MLNESKLERFAYSLGIALAPSVGETAGAETRRAVRRAFADYVSDRDALSDLDEQMAFEQAAAEARARGRDRGRRGALQLLENEAKDEVIAAAHAAAIRRRKNAVLPQEDVNTSLSKETPVSGIDRHTYQKDLEAVNICLDDLAEKMDAEEIGPVRNQYRRDLLNLKRSGVVVNVDEELSRLPADRTRAERFAENRLELIRSNYQRAIGSNPGFEQSLKPAIRSAEQQRMAVARACADGVSLEEASRRLGFSA